jgi:hypothetical protein
LLDWTVREIKLRVEAFYFHELATFAAQNLTTCVERKRKSRARTLYRTGEGPVERLAIGAAGVKTTAFPTLDCLRRFPFNCYGC